MEILVIISLLVIVLLVGILVYLFLKMKDLMEVEKNYSIMTKNYSTVTILQEIMMILGAKIPSGEKLERINEILINRFDIAYSTIVEYTEDGSIVKASNIPREMHSQIVNIDRVKGYAEAMTQNVPKYVTGIKTLEYETAEERDIRSVLMFPLYREDEYKGYWILEDIRSNAFDNIEESPAFHY